jgi:hypothetical protein
MTPDMADYCRRALAADGGVCVDPLPGREMSNDIAIRFNVKSSVFMALNPRIGDAWMFGLHQCSRFRQWTDSDKRLF